MPAAIALLDTNVLVPFHARNTLLWAAHVGFYVPRWSQDILLELARTLRMDIGLPAAAVDDLLATIREAFPHAAVAGYEALAPTLTNDPKDRHVLAAAITGGASVIVTANRRDFPAASLRPPVIEVQTADLFLAACALSDRRRTLRFLDAQRRGMTLSQPPTIDALLDQLAPALPGFVAAVRG